MSVNSTIDVEDQYGTKLHVASDGSDITASIIPKVGSANGGVPSVELDETDRLKLRSWLIAVTS